MWPEHEQPYDSQRFTFFGLQHRLTLTGFDYIRIEKSNVGLSALLQLSIELIESWARRFFSSSRILFISWRFLTLVPYTFINTFALITCWFIRANSSNDLYLDLVVSAHKPCT